jgi:hypothetical protein
LNFLTHDYRYLKPAVYQKIKQSHPAAKKTGRVKMDVK